VSYVGRPEPGRIREEGGRELIQERKSHAMKEEREKKRSLDLRRDGAKGSRRSLRESKLLDAEAQSQRHGR
jgi:hypothetical protein